MADTITFSVPDMSCGHCRASIDTALTPLGLSTAFDMDERRITVSGTSLPDPVIAALDEIGFDATLVQG